MARPKKGSSSSQRKTSSSGSTDIRSQDVQTVKGDPQRARSHVQSLIKEPPFVAVKGLKAMAKKPGGFAGAKARQQAWSRLLGTSPTQATTLSQKIKCTSAHQVDLDVERSLWLVDDALRPKYRQRLRVLINNLLAEFPQFHYFQGLHDVVSVIMLTCNNDMLAYNILKRLAACHLRDMLEPNLDQIRANMIGIESLVRKFDIPLAVFLIKAQARPMFAVSWVLTWFSHTVQDDEQVKQIFDACIASHPWYIYYLSAALIMEHSEPVRKLECDMASVHGYFTKIDKIDVQAIVKRADKMFQAVPPNKLPSLRPLFDPIDTSVAAKDSPASQVYSGLLAEIVSNYPTKPGKDTFTSFPPVAEVSPTRNLLFLSAATAVGVAMWLAGTMAIKHSVL
eukprot:m.38857 g.38857  ORF g.38857 m.38857 type:complete len:394 (-) comp10257_c1_seq1:281-1462(-)